MVRHKTINRNTALSLLGSGSQDIRKDADELRLYENWNAIPYAYGECC
jgi:hypothetical protein